MISHSNITDQVLREQIRTRMIVLAGNSKLKIYGTLDCKSGKRMKKSNRVFFRTSGEALSAGFRPCGHCMISDYQNWKDGSI
jgi:methylphosphotriester-DNA--protein-cysteine methyltransferase